MVAAGIMCQIYSMTGFLKEAFFRGQGWWGSQIQTRELGRKRKKKTKQKQHTAFSFVVSVSPQRWSLNALEMPTAILSIYHPSLIQPSSLQPGHLSHHSSF